MIFGSKSAVSDITSRRRGDGSSAGERRSRFADAVLVVLCKYCFCAGALESTAALPELVARRVRRERTLTMLMLKLEIRLWDI